MTGYTRPQHDYQGFRAFATTGGSPAARPAASLSNRWRDSNVAYTVTPFEEFKSDRPENKISVCRSSNIYFASYFRAQLAPVRNCGRSTIEFNALATPARS